MADKPLDFERKLFKKNINSLQNCFLNFMFKLDKQGVQRRKYLLTIFGSILFIMWIAIEINTLLAQIKIDKTFALDLLIMVFRFGLVFIIPYFIAINSASAYLGDIFELDDSSIAKEFINQAAFGSAYGEITIKNGEVADKDKNSPIIKIGGPGKITVDLHSVALFEKADGRPHIIGPTVEIENDENILDGFERLRDVVDLRDIVIGPKNISARTQDGLKISAEDVRMAVSINRGSAKDKKRLTSYTTYPFWEEAILGLIYQQSCQVSHDRSKKDSCSKWTTSMDGKFSGALKGFISKHKLCQFISTEGSPEMDDFHTRREEFDKIKKTVLSEFDENVETSSKDVKEGIEFQTRDKISQLFTEFVKEFNEENSEENVTLNWIGIGTWKTPSGIIPEQHLKAWRLSKENAKEGSAKNLEKVENKEKIEEMLRQIKKVPLSSANLSGAPNYYRKQALRQMLTDYRALIYTSVPYILKYVESQ